MKYIYSWFLMVFALPYFAFSQDSLALIPGPSTYYKDMFPSNVDETKLLVLLPFKRSKEEIGNITDMKSEDSLNTLYESYIKITDQTIQNIKNHIQKYQINCDIVEGERYSVEAYPTERYPLVVFPELFVKDRYYVTSAYYMIDVQKKLPYGYVMGGDIYLDEKYFKQLSKYITKLKQQKIKSKVTGADAANFAENKIYKQQKEKKAMVKYVLKPVVYTAGILGVLGIALLLN